jgi:uncharacterized membrane protein
METIEKTVKVDRPVSTVYNQWTQFEEFPRFMDGVEQVTQLSDARQRWEAQIMGVRRDWEAEITRQEPDRLIEWVGFGGEGNTGTITFDPVGDHTRVTLRMDWEPSGMVEKAGDVLNIVDRRIEGDLERFKEFIEERDTETGAYRGEIG